MLKKKNFIMLVLLLVTGALLFYAGKLSQKPRIEMYPPGIVPERIMLTWNDSVYNTQTVTWRTDSTVHVGYAEIAPAAESAEEITDIKRIIAHTRTYSSEVNTANYHTAKFTGLKPGTQYVYRVGDGKTWSEWFQFTTANKEAKDFSFLYYGDVQEGIKQHGSRVIRKGYASCPNAAFMLFAGDMVDHPYDNDFGEFFYAGDWLFASTPIIALAGNHEYKRNVPGGLGDIWKYQFNFPQNGPEGLKSTVYYIDYQGVRIIVLDTEGMKHLPGTFNKQSEWLESVLRNNPNQWTIVAMHHPVFSNSGGRDNPRVRKHLKPIFDKYNVDLVLEGHDHSYGRTEFKGSDGHEGPVYVITNAGPKMYDLGFTPQMKRLASRTQLYQVIDVTHNSIHFSSYTATGKLYDAFML
ncbi:MAG: metallophosphoesterase family protein, partial [Bacteroidota bacterium]|nr:metallophosphoesterase family protein [Bacteroidota bacterium]